MQIIFLTKGKCVQVDDRDFEYLNQFQWCAEPQGNTFYAKRTHKNRSVLMHRVILGLTFGDGIHADHKDRDGLNNQRTNLRKSTRSENQCNKAGYGASKYLGVSFEKDRKKWCAKLTKDGVCYRLGRFISEHKAALAYNEAAIIHHGEFANLNIIK